jgi:hypothetical protein
MADALPPHIFNGSYHATAMANVRIKFESGALAAASAVVDVLVNRLRKVAVEQPKCGADLKGLMGARAVLMMLARPNVHLDPADVNAWIECQRARILAALDTESTAALRAPQGSVLADQHGDWMAACRIARCDGLFKPDTKSAPRRAKIKLSKARPRPAAEHLEAFS